jgi:hypothetical protein
MLVSSGLTTPPCGVPRALLLPPPMRRVPSPSSRYSIGDAGQPFPDADAALRHAAFLAVQLSKGGHLVGSSILVAKDDEVIFEVPLSRLRN